MGRKKRWVEQEERELHRLLHRLRQQSDDVQPLTIENPRGMDGHVLIGSGKNFIALPGTQPTLHPPGSLERIEEYRLRVSRCEELWHAEDCDGPAVYKTHGGAKCKL